MKSDSKKTLIMTIVIILCFCTVIISPFVCQYIYDIDKWYSISMCDFLQNNEFTTESDICSSRNKKLSEFVEDAYKTFDDNALITIITKNNVVFEDAIINWILRTGLASNKEKIKIISIEAYSPINQPANWRMSKHYSHKRLYSYESKLVRRNVFTIRFSTNWHKRYVLIIEQAQWKHFYADAESVYSSKTKTDVKEFIINPNDNKGITKYLSPKSALRAAHVAGGRIICYGPYDTTFELTSREAVSEKYYHNICRDIVIVDIQLSKELLPFPKRVWLLDEKSEVWWSEFL